MAGKSTRETIVYILHPASEALDKSVWAVRFFGDFRKGFDLIDHKILLDKLSNLSIHNICWDGSLHSCVKDLSFSASSDIFTYQD